MKKFTTIFLALILIFLIFVQKTYAHVLQTDGSIGAVLHLNPEDDPIVGQNTEIMFELKDTSNKFDPQMCNCTISVSNDSKVIYQTSILTSTENTEQMINVVFPQKGIYKIAIKGIPRENSFQPFLLQYDIRVERTSVQSARTVPANLTSLAPLLFIPIAAFLILAFISSVRKKK